MRGLTRLALSVLAISSTALAADPGPTETRSARSMYIENPFAFGLQAAPLGSSLGVLGIWVDYALLPELSITGGAGVGVSAEQPWQYGIALRPRFPVERFIAWDLTVGVSRGDYREISLGDPMATYTSCTWFNADVGPEFRFESGIVLHPFLGFSKLIASDTPIWSDGSAFGNYSGTRWPLLSNIGITFGTFFK